MPSVAFIHPDLGIGGAERLVVDAAVGLQDAGFKVTAYTSHCDRSHCFEEVSSGLLNVHVYGDFLPVSVLGKLHILCAIVRQLYLGVRLVVSRESGQYDYFFVDQLSFIVPLLRIFGRGKVVFYCHFPDQLLAKKGGRLKQLYRVPFDAIEEWTTGVSDRIMVNSLFTKLIFHKTFTHLAIEPDVVHPCIDVAQVEEDRSATEKEVRDFFKGDFLLSINRFERLKNIELAIKAFAKVEKLKLVIAGGFDSRVAENVHYLRELEAVCDGLGLKHITVRGRLVEMPLSTRVVFLPSVRSDLKNVLLQSAQLLLYTPTFEHFGIVPVESMLYKTPVIAIDRGGPLETVVGYDGSNGEVATGYHRPNDVDEWAACITGYLALPEEVKMRMSENGRKRALEHFSREQLSKSLQSSMSKASTSKGVGILRLWWVPLLLAFLAVMFGKS